MKTNGTLAFVTSLVHAQNSSIVMIPDEWLYLLPQPFNSSIRYSWLNSKTTADAAIDDVSSRAGRSRFVSYADGFAAMVGANPNVSTIQCPADAPQCAFEAGVCLPETDDV